MAGFEFLEVFLGDRGEGNVEIAGDVGEIPEDIAELLFYLLLVFLGGEAVFIAEEFLDLVGSFAGFTDEAEDFFEEIGRLQVRRKLEKVVFGGEFGVFIKIHKWLLLKYYSMCGIMAKYGYKKSGR